EEDQDALEVYFLDYIKSNAKKITYEIKESKIDGDNATVAVDFKYVNGGPLLKATFGEYMKEAFASAFTGKELTDEENSEIFISAMEAQSEKMEETFTEKTLNIECVKIEDNWYIDDPSDELLDVIMSGILSAGK